MKKTEFFRASQYIAKKYVILVFLLLSVLVVIGCAPTAPSKNQVDDAIREFVLSDENPIVNSYQDYSYQLERSDTGDKEYLATYQLTEKSILSEVTIELSTEWYEYDQGWEIINISIEDTLASPFNGPTKDEISEVLLALISSSGQSLSQSIEVLSQDWQAGSNFAQVETSASNEYLTCVENIEYTLELEWNVSDEKWVYSDIIDYQGEINFDRLNGTWRGVYTTQYMDPREVIFQISDAGIYRYDDSDAVCTISLNHNLNDVGIDAKTKDFSIISYNYGLIINLDRFYVGTRALLIGTDRISFEMDGSSTPLDRVSDIQILETRQAYLEDAHMTSRVDDQGMPADSITSVSSTGTWIVSSILRDTQTDTIVHYVWYDTNGEIIDTYDLDPQGAKDIYIFSSLELTSSAPSGQYRVEISISDSSESATVVEFTVE